ncbi:HAMP domain-containing sensor histidine kinase [Sphingomonas sp. KR1UV-12]|uniref:histidine kinase n=1 Tax=Sphingomonas aurea TaxID=3063994 RepID=A0ABT9EI59_9SPHN|nr:HAMP domain-containing sensor histidine kinase [Sphingomonas sp. KR1UV-12]MDP1026646.1 HAMP domain-containing sensor histidine kinase [Sphingomonas sp. KR1UV-12]
MKPTSTTTRLAVLVFGFQVVSAATLVIGLGAYVRWEVTAEADGAVRVMREDLLSVYARDGLRALARAIDDRATRRATPGAVMLLADRDFTRMAGTLAAWPRDLSGGRTPIDATLLRPGKDQSESMRVMTTRLPDGTHLLTGMVVQGELRALAAVGEASAAALVLAILLALVTALVSARLFDAQLAEPIEALESARRGDLAQRVDDGGGTDAFAALGRVVNTTLDRLQGLIAELKLATDAMAHDLKSPITRLRSALDHADRALADPDAARIALRRAQDEGTRLLGVVDTALSISRAQAGIGRDSFRAVDLPAMLEDLAEIYGPLAEDAGRSIAVAADGVTAVVPVHRELLGQALGNLIDNSLKYGAGAIRLTLARTDTRLELGVIDEGTGIAPQDRETALRKFGRLDAARSGTGAGLGLSLVAAVAHLHGGEVSLRDAEPGLAVCLALPIGFS